MKKLNKIVSLCLIIVIVSTITPITTFASGETKVSVVSAGMQHSAAIKADKSLYTWGDNSFGQLGTGDTVNANQPVLVLKNAVSVSCGYDTTAAITSDGSLYMWGKNYYGIFGNGDVSNSLTPLKVAEKVSVVSVGNFHTAIIKTDGTLYMTGNNNYGQLGTGDTMAYT
ncbi:MAG: hypothetical protein GX802_04540, partial [Clostridiales bacterium]|nr:hypothetical protein [Clostridiales bacterium]